MSHWLELAPISNYVMGRDMRLSYHLQSKKHAWYVGIATHMNFTKQRYSITNDVYRTNGFARDWYDHIHFNVGYERFYKWNEHFEPYFFVDANGGSIKLLNYFYIPTGYDNAGNLLEYTLVNGFGPYYFAKYAQLTFGLGAKIKMTDRLSLTSRVGVGESFTRSYYYSTPFLRIYSNTFDHIIGHYQVGVRYKFK